MTEKRVLIQLNPPFPIMSQVISAVCLLAILGNTFGFSTSAKLPSNEKLADLLDHTMGILISDSVGNHNQECGKYPTRGCNRRQASV